MGKRSTQFTKIKIKDSDLLQFYVKTLIIYEKILFLNHRNLHIHYDRSFPLKLLWNENYWLKSSKLENYYKTGHGNLDTCSLYEHWRARKNGEVSLMRTTKFLRTLSGNLYIYLKTSSYCYSYQCIKFKINFFYFYAI